jgi:hypothetical protein
MKISNRANPLGYLTLRQEYERATEMQFKLEWRLLLALEAHDYNSIGPLNAEAERAWRIRSALRVAIRYRELMDVNRSALHGGGGPPRTGGRTPSYSHARPKRSRGKRADGRVISLQRASLLSRSRLARRTTDVHFPVIA